VFVTVEEARREASSVRVELDSMSANMNQVSTNLRIKEMVRLCSIVGSGIDKNNWKGWDMNRRIEQWCKKKKKKNIKRVRGKFI